MINPFTQQQIADITGQTSVNVNRVFADLERQGLIRREGRDIFFNDWRELRRVASFQPGYLRLSGDIRGCARDAYARLSPGQAAHEAWWARQGLNLRPHPCEGCALPLSYAPMPGRSALKRALGACPDGAAAWHSYY